MIHKLYKTGNSIVITLPKKALHAVGLKPGAHAYVTFTTEFIRITPVPNEKEVTFLPDGKKQKDTEPPSQRRTAKPKR